MNSAELGWILCSPLPPITYFRIYKISSQDLWNLKVQIFILKRFSFLLFSSRVKLKATVTRKPEKYSFVVPFFYFGGKKKTTNQTIVDQLQAHCFCSQPFSGPACLLWGPCSATGTPLLPSSWLVHASGPCYYPGSFSLHCRYYNSKHWPALTVCFLPGSSALLWKGVLLRCLSTSECWE